MAQVDVSLIATNDQDCSVTLLVAGRPIEFFIGDAYHTNLPRIRHWLSAEWNNNVISHCTKWASQIIVEGNRVHLQRKAKKMSTSIPHQNAPSKEFSFTVIAPQAKSITYNGERMWFKTDADARAFAAGIFEGETRKNFDLCIVQCLDIVAPKPQIELTSRW